MKFLDDSNFFPKKLIWHKYFQPIRHIIFTQKSWISQTTVKANVRHKKVRNNLLQPKMRFNFLVTFFIILFNRLAICRNKLKAWNSSLLFFLSERLCASFAKLTIFVLQRWTRRAKCAAKLLPASISAPSPAKAARWVSPRRINYFYIFVLGAIVKEDGPWAKDVKIIAPLGKKYHEQLRKNVLPDVFMPT